MNWLASLERRFGRFAIHGLIRWVVAFNAAVFVIYLMNPLYLGWLALDPERVRHGEIWRLVTYLFIPPVTGSRLLPDYLWIVFVLQFYWMLGDGLEQAWGAFRVTIFYLLGMIGTTIAAMLFGVGYNNVMLNLSLLFAFATLYPDFSILLFLILPVKIKWLAWFSLAVVLLEFLGGAWSERAAILAALANYILFFTPSLAAQARQRQATAARRMRFGRPLPEAPADTIHCCEKCKRTEASDPDLEFRVAADGREYCLDHLPAKT